MENAFKQACQKLYSEYLKASVECCLVRIPKEVQIVSDWCTTEYRQECKDKSYMDCPDTRDGKLGIGCERIASDSCEMIPHQICGATIETETTYEYRTVYEEVEEIICEPTTSDNKWI